MVALQKPSELDPAPLPEEPDPSSEEQAPPNPLQLLRMDPGRVGLATMLEEMAKLRLIRELKLPDNLFPNLSRKVLAVYRNRASVEEPSRLRAHPKAHRLTLLAVLCSLRAQEITDALVELLIQIVHKKDVRSRRLPVSSAPVNERCGIGSSEVWLPIPDPDARGRVILTRMPRTCLNAGRTESATAPASGRRSPRKVTQDHNAWSIGS